jgi:hypothetical protein
MVGVKGSKLLVIGSLALKILNSFHLVKHLPIYLLYVPLTHTLNTSCYSSKKYLYHILNV